MYGAIIAFKNFQPALGIMGSPWVGFAQFERFFNNPDFLRILKNTLVISITDIVFGFPAPIILALLFNELKMQKFKSLAQTISYLPHFISLVVVCGLVKTFVSQGGIILQLVTALGGNWTMDTNNKNGGYVIPVAHAESPVELAVIFPTLTIDGI